MMTNWFKLSCFVMISAFLAIVLWSAHAAFVLDNVAIYGENGPLETLQAILLAISCLVFLAPVVLKKGQEKLIPLFLSLLCYSFTLRELDVERLNVHDAVKFLGSGIGRNTTLAVAFMTILVYAGFNFSYYKRAALLFIKSRPGILLLTAGLLLFVAELFEKSHSISHNAFYEEIIELCGYFFILASALAANTGITRGDDRLPRGGRWD